jgi:predicted enzyme related to lactoylglutathione lyase
MTNPAGSFVWYELITPDPDGAAAFYGSVVGWKISGDSDPIAGGVDYRHILRSDGGSGGGVLRLTDEMKQGGARPCWLGYLSVPDVDAEVSSIAVDGGRLLAPAFDLPVGRIAMVADPGGVPIYVMKPIPPTNDPDASSDVYDRDTVQRVSWNELYTPDLDAAKTFYSKHFHFEFNDSMPMGDMGDYCFIDHGGQTIGAMMRKPPHVPAPGWNFYIRVPNIERAKAAVEAGGGKVTNGPMQVPGGEWVLNGIDPQGAPFALVAAGKA